MEMPINNKTFSKSASVEPVRECMNSGRQAWMNDSAPAVRKPSECPKESVWTERNNDRQKHLCHGTGAMQGAGQLE
jgi:hypothetical protein